MYRALISFLALAICQAQQARGQACPAAAYTVVTKLLMSASSDMSMDNNARLPECLGLNACQMTSVQWGQCGAAKSQKIEGAQKAATIALSPAGCTEVFNCNGVYVDTDTYAAVSLANAMSSPLPPHWLPRNQSLHGCVEIHKRLWGQVTGQACTPTDFGGQAAAVCAGVLLPSVTLKAITGNQCTGVNNCAQLKRRSLLAATADLKCTSVKVTLGAESQAQAAGVQQKLQSSGALSELSACLGVQVTAIGPNSKCLP